MHAFRALERSLPVLAVAGLAAGCAAPPQLKCAVGQQPMRSESLYFGTNKATGGTVTDAEWQAFLNEEITPRFPDGLSVARVSGQWKSNNGTIVVEASQVLSVVHLNLPKQQRAFKEILAAYKTRFSQESVLQVSTPACVAF